jgi:hypothetical protein
MSDVDQCRLEILTSVAIKRAAIRAAARKDRLCGFCTYGENKKPRTTSGTR